MIGSIIKEILGLFVDDEILAIGILAIVGLAAAVALMSSGWTVPRGSGSRDRTAGYSGGGRPAYAQTLDQDIVASHAGWRYAAAAWVRGVTFSPITERNMEKDPVLAEHGRKNTFIINLLRKTLTRAEAK